MTRYAHFNDVPADGWRWANFSPRELACRGTGRLLVNEAALDKLQTLRDRLGRPMVITSGYRSPEHNQRVGGARNSLHMQGIAFDVRMDNHDPADFEAAARAVGFTGFGFYPRSGFMHIDTGPAREWGERFPEAPTALTPEPPARRPTESRTIAGGVTAAVGGIGSAVAEAAEAVEPVAGISEVARWAFVALVLIGAGLAIYARLDDMRRRGE